MQNRGRRIEPRCDREDGRGRAGRAALGAIADLVAIGAEIGAIEGDGHWITSGCSTLHAGHGRDGVLRALTTG